MRIGQLAGLAALIGPVLGIPDEAALVAAFCAKTGLERPANWDALIAFQCFRFAAILQGVLKRHL
jgi:aminoglycoside phosphotransferase (APT) family kinase protein